jgi:hypothetical protein
MLDVHGETVVNGETLPMDIWSAYMAKATAEDQVLDFPRPNRREFVPLSRGYAVNPTASSPSATTPVSSADEVRRRYGYESGPPRR